MHYDGASWYLTVGLNSTLRLGLVGLFTRLHLVTDEAEDNGSESSWSGAQIGAKSAQRRRLQEYQLK